MLEGDWYHPTPDARQAAYDLVETVFKESLPAPEAHVSRERGIQCEWVSRTGSLVVVLDADGNRFLVTSPHGEGSDEEINLPSLGQITEALRNLYGL